MEESQIKIKRDSACSSPESDPNAHHPSQLYLPQVCISSLTVLLGFHFHLNVPSMSIPISKPISSVLDVASVNSLSGRRRRTWLVVLDLLLLQNPYSAILYSHDLCAFTRRVCDVICPLLTLDHDASETRRPTIYLTNHQQLVPDGRLLHCTTNSQQKTKTSIRTE